MSGDRILIIDDEEVVRSSCQKILEEKNHLIDTAGTGEEGLDMMARENYDLVVTDLKMPGMSGMEVLQKIRDEYPDVTVIIFTGYATVETTRQALKMGAFDYIPKPFTPDDFRTVIGNALAERQKEDDSEKKLIDLMAVVSHELQSPLSVVHTTAQTLSDGYLGDLGPKQQRTVDAILRNCIYLEDIIRNYLDYSRLEMEDFGSYREDKKMVEDILEPVITIPENARNFREMPLEKDFQVNPTLRVDAYLIQIVVRNYVSNGIKYGKDKTPLRISLKKEGNEYLFSVFNEGVGIPDEGMDKLFTRYGRLRQKGTEGIKGNGLGLYMCRDIIEKHGGRVWAESEPGQWACFYFALPESITVS